jgi:Transglutaminase-like superfamily
MVMSIKFMRTKWLRLWRHPRAKKWLALQSLVLSLLSVIALRLISFGRWKGILKASSCGRIAAPTFSRDDVSVAEAYASVVDMVARNTPCGLVTCLPRSLTLWWLLRRHGVESELRIGVRRDGEQLVAHAWVVCHGTVIGETKHEQFMSFESAVLAT